MISRLLFFNLIAFCLPVTAMERQDACMPLLRIINDSNESYVLMISAMVPVNKLTQILSHKIPEFHTDSIVGIARLLTAQKSDKQASQFEMHMLPELSSDLYFTTRRGLCLLQARLNMLAENNEEVVLTLQIPGDPEQKMVPRRNEVAVVRINEWGAPKFADN